MAAERTGVRQEPALSVIDAVVHKHNTHPGAIIAILQEVQDAYGYIPVSAIIRISQDTAVPASDIYGIVTFYSQFRLQPQGENTIKICDGTACHLNGADKITDVVCRCTGAREGETSADGKFTVEKVACLGCCSLSPTIMVNDEAFGRLTPESVVQVIEEFRRR